jgi:hypothetical protein
MFRLAGRVDAAKAALNGEGHQPCGVRFLPCGAINDPGYADFAARVDESVHESAITEELHAQVVEPSCVDQVAEGGGIRGGETVAGEAGGLPLYFGTASRSAAPGHTVFLCERSTNTHWYLRYIAAMRFLETEFANGFDGGVCKGKPEAAWIRAGKISVCPLALCQKQLTRLSIALT